MCRVIHFEIHAEDLERAAKFYKDVFGWTITKWQGPEEYWLVITGSSDEPGINGAIMRRTGAPSGDSILAYVCTISVPSVDEYTTKIRSSGGQITMPKKAIPTIGWFAYCKDPEGNTFGIMQEDKSAKEESILHQA